MCTPIKGNVASMGDEIASEVISFMARRASELDELNSVLAGHLASATEENRRLEIELEATREELAALRARSLPVLAS